MGLDAAIDGDGSWEAVTLPHTWNAEDGHTGGNDYHRGACWYRRELDLGPAAEGGRVLVEFGAGGMVADVHVDRAHLIQHRGGYSIFRADVTDALDHRPRLAWSRLRAITIRWISLVPSPMVQILASR